MAVADELVESMIHPADQSVRSVWHAGSAIGGAGHHSETDATTDGSPLPDAISRDALINILAELEPGVTEMATHPGTGDDLDSMYRSERAQEMEVLTDARTRAAIDEMGIELRSFDSIARQQ